MISQVVIIDDEKELTDIYVRYLGHIGVNDISAINDSREFFKTAERLNPAIILLDMNMPYHNGEEVLDFIMQKIPEASVVMMIEKNETESTVRCLQKGAVSFIVKPVDKDALANVILRALEANRGFHGKRVINFSENREEYPFFNDIVTGNSKMLEIFRYLNFISESSFPVLITGETGTGKELFAEAVHKASGRRGPYVAVNISGLDDNMFTDTLFGHVKGAFTGADKARKGLVAEADNGTLFLDEIGDLHESAQIKLLRLLQEKVYMPLGSDRNTRANVRIIAATSVNLKNNVKTGKFRKDLLFRISTHCITIPPLRERKDDIEILALNFYNKALLESGCQMSASLPHGIGEILKNYSFPGNVRQLQAIMNDLALITRGRHLSGRDMISFMRRHDIGVRIGAKEHTLEPFCYSGEFPTIKRMESLLVSSAISHSKGNITDAAKILGITRQTLHRLIKNLDKLQT
ncbi:sigma-54 dependent transcriptional regulator [Seleniivibrio woodruffii]|uniref:sigma-54-dependent transcriptional regulator n=1 Tax=Seleniivibrio woodruffii TaxID=1078050 RepID=UPI0026EDE47F|nr:sigma-54 dependent transcriptional regulator [Seleniivibrio woodruffii]